MTLTSTYVSVTRNLERRRRMEGRTGGGGAKSCTGVGLRLSAGPGTGQDASGINSPHCVPAPMNVYVTRRRLPTTCAAVAAAAVWLDFRSGYLLTPATNCWQDATFTQ